MKRSNRPPAFAESILKSAFRFDDMHRLLDYEELYEIRLKKLGKKKADLWYWGFALKSFPNLIKNSIYWGGAMFSNYMKIALRNIRKNKVFSVINISGLAIAMAVSVFILNFVNYHLNFDAFNSNEENIYRLVIGDGEENFAGTPAPLGDVLKDNLSEVEEYVRVGKSTWGKKIAVSYAEVKFNEDKLFLTDGSFFRVFDYPLKSGNPETVFNDPNSIVITESVAAKYFGDENPIGKTLKIDGRFDLQVTGVAYDFPDDSHIHFDLMAPFIIIDKFYSSEGYLESWGMSNYYTYLLLKPGVTPEQIKSNAGMLNQKFPRKSVEYFKGLIFQPLGDIHLTEIRYNLEPVFEKKYAYIFSFTAILVLVVACINFINLTTARATNRASEIGLRKVIGAQRNQIAKQFLGEAVLLSLIAGLMALMLIYLLAPLASDYLGINFRFDPANSYFLITILGIPILAGIISGLYPAIVLSSLQPVKIMHRKFVSTPGGSLLKKILVVFQFAITVIFMVAVVTILDQMNYLKEQNIGWQRENIVNFPIYETELRKNIEPLKNKLLQNPKILNASQSRFIPSRNPYHHGIWFEGQTEEDNKSMWLIYADYDIVETMGLEITQGRNFSREMRADDKGAYLLNQAAIRELGWDDPIGKDFSAYRDGTSRKVVGVVKDFNFRSLHFNVQPCMIYLRPSGGDHLSLKIAGGDIQGTIRFIENTWKNYTGSNSFEYFFMDDDFNRVYKAETDLGNMLSAFSILSVLIASLGLFGLASFLAQQKRKEIGIRKVLGASVPSIFTIFTSEFLKLFIVAVLISAPILFKIYSEWITNFAYQAPVNALSIIAALFTILVVFVLTIGVQAVQSALANPIKSIREE